MYDETLWLVGSSPPNAISRSAIAEGANVSRQTLYNRWATTADIVLDALLDRAEQTVGASDQPDVADLRSYLIELATAVNGWARPGLRPLAALAQSDAAFADRFRTEFLIARHGALTAAIRSGTEGSALAAHRAELIAGSLWFRVLITDTELDDNWIDDMTVLATGTDRADMGRYR